MKQVKRDSSRLSATVVSADVRLQPLYDGSFSEFLEHDKEKQWDVIDLLIDEIPITLRGGGEYVAIGRGDDLSDPDVVNAIRVGQRICLIIEHAVFALATGDQYDVEEISLSCLQANLQAMDNYLKLHILDIPSLRPLQTYAVDFRTEIERRLSYEPAKPGYIYLIESTHGYYKIGLSRTPVQRIKTLGVKLPFPIKVQHLILTNHMYKAEKVLHEQYATKRVNGEWFDLTENDIADIKAITRFDVKGVQE